MEDWLNIPKDRKSLRPVRLSILLGVTALLFLTMAAAYSWV